LIWVNTETRQPSILLLTQTARGDPMHAADVMTSEVISVDENATVPAVARLLAGRGISAVPVVDKDNQVIGMVSEGDLLHRAETGTERRRSWWLDIMASTNKLAGDYIKSHSAKVKDVMTRKSSPSPRRLPSPIPPFCWRRTGSSVSRSCATANWSGS
jgi:CBS-domain-containing membrane protein